MPNYSTVSKSTAIVNGGNQLLGACGSVDSGDSYRAVRNVRITLLSTSKSRLAASKRRYQ